MEIISNIALISINETIFAQLASFLIFLYIMNRMMFKPLRSIIQERNDHILSVQEEITNAEQKLDDVKKMLQENEKAVKKEAFSIKEELETSGSEKASEIFDEVRKEIENLRLKAQQDVKSQLDEARKSLQNESEKLVIQIIEKVLERRLA